MQPGERAAIYVLDPQYGFGDGGSFSFPAVPPKSQLVYDMTLLDWDAPTEVGQSRLAGSRVGVLGRHQGRRALGFAASDGRPDCSQAACGPAAPPSWGRACFPPPPPPAS